MHSIKIVTKFTFIVIIKKKTRMNQKSVGEAEWRELRERWWKKLSEEERIGLMRLASNGVRLLNLMTVAASFILVIPFFILPNLAFKSSSSIFLISSFFSISSQYSIKMFDNSKKCLGNSANTVSSLFSLSNKPSTFAV